MANIGDSLWLMRLASRRNILVTKTPYVPISLSEIEPYTKLEDFTIGRVKTIETIGILRPVDTSIAILRSTTNKPKIKLVLDIGNLCPDYAYPKDLRTDYAGWKHLQVIPDYGLRHAWKPVKINGYLEIRNGNIVIVVHSINLVKDVEGCEKILSMMSKLSRTQLKMYNYDSKENKQLQFYRERKKKNCQSAGSRRSSRRGKKKKNVVKNRSSLVK